MKLSLLLPVLNHEERLRDTLSRLREATNGEDVEILVVFDVTRPALLPEIEQLRDEIREQFGALSLVRTAERGFGSALRHAGARATGDLLMPIMADQSDDVAVIPSMIRKIETGADVVVGARYVKGGRTVGNTPKQRLSWLYTRIAAVLTTMDCGDMSNSFKMYRRAVWERVRPASNSFDLSVELAVKAAALGYRMDYVPSTWVNRDVGTSNFRIVREVRNYGKWLALAVMTQPSKLVIVAGLGLPLIVRRMALRNLTATSEAHRIEPSPTAREA